MHLAAAGLAFHHLGRELFIKPGRFRQGESGVLTELGSLGKGGREGRRQVRAWGLALLGEPKSFSLWVQVGAMGDRSGWGWGGPREILQERVTVVPVHTGESPPNTRTAAPA